LIGSTVVLIAAIRSSQHEKIYSIIAPMALFFFALGVSLIYVGVATGWEPKVPREFVEEVSQTAPSP
jgi:hypothetical protein